jgi:GNAT superfamily N-acetyltransferase
MSPSFGETTVPDGRNARFGPVFRLAEADDAGQIAMLHADSWRRHYRGAYADSFLDGDVGTDRRSVWSARLAVPANSATILAERDGRLVGFVHVVFDDDPGWGSFVDNLHVGHDQRRTGIGTQLLGRAARAVVERATGNAMYLWVLRQNTAAQQFYRACGATCVETAPVPPPGGDPARLNGTPSGLRMAWPDVASLCHLLDGR